MFSSLRNHDYYCSCNLALNFILVLWPNGLMEQEQGERLSIYQIISKESSSNDKQLTKQARCRWHEPYGNFIENRYRRRGISNVRIKYSKTLAVVLAGSIVAGVPSKKYSALVVFVPWTNHAADTLGWKKKSVFQTDCCRPTASNRFWIHDRIQFQSYLFFFFLLFLSLLFTYVRAFENVRGKMKE